MLHFTRLLIPVAFVFAVGCQASEDTDCTTDPQGAECIENPIDNENTTPGNGTDPDTTDTTGDSDTATDPDEQTQPVDPASEQAPNYHTTDELTSHLTELAAIATANQNNRAAGTSGYAESVDYVRESLESWGYEVTLQGFTIDIYDIGADPILETLSQTEWVYGEDYGIIHYSPGADVNATMVAVDIEPSPEGPANSTNSGCQPGDFADFTAGSIAIIQRGSCTFEEKSLNAQNAGAIAVVIFNEGQSGREDLFDGALNENNDIEIPVLSASYAVGISLVTESENPENNLHLMSDVTFGAQLVHNVIADYSGASDDFWMAGAHLDSVPEGPGINDNGTGVANILETARYIATNAIELNHGVRFAFWSGEELGLLGSTHYVQELTNEDASHILGYLNLDMIGSPKPGRFIYDGDESDYQSSMSLPEGSGKIEKAYEDFFNVRGVPHAPTRLDGRSDYYAFMAVGIPSGGLFSGAEDTISMEDSQLFDLPTNDYYDACYHRACDGLDNIHFEVFTQMSDATTHVLTRLANSDDSVETRTLRQTRGPAQEHSQHLQAAPHKGCHSAEIVR
ncbi:MAG: M20/M25/M40 family metallo-hydrolase [Deltaproteobacteria bacterium]|nr:M20/M25/M40 family metallo-hydrolase [Deltaproteobacteria bacterium]MBT6434805.1 M20/M25/M40 family metallo-hydrolase [Deltaproteobacteria bacterium]MBT6492260.1 M20/M25/M40 family metallo-hydrolase [Deltaproteobacteria bacterium]